MKRRCAVRWKTNDARTRCLLDAGHQTQGQLAHVGNYREGRRHAWVCLYDPEYILRSLAGMF